MSNDSAPLTNGETPHSKSFSHLKTYPAFNDTYEGFKNTNIGASTLNIASSTYNRFVAPFHPYLQRPYSVAHPYLTRADELGDTGLSKLETYVPVVKEDTQVLKKYAFAPYNYVAGTWQEQYERTSHQNGLVKTGLAVVSTELKIFQDACTVFLDYWNSSKGGQKVNEKVEQVKQ
ncbi:hypothetical protein HBI56_025200 [Parastagonospora nodorum]|nr:hypothetical protein HBH56_012870 [Parastagonospora nodorum]QRC94817.1 hypothetical protein JI435_025670 [Parastagonospora nodorum SN15]KAH3937045.1 hypothetical protein HBH54_021570 [Parastagonospora nodorum]KAH3953836.1 hypothetical protein HBH53_033970 [Parastagonospora nodorum]KAH3969246.1 hypothetical protein HBH51_126120 [Parastagonospora nodorum]